MVGASNYLHEEASRSLEKEEKKEKKRRKGSQDKSKPSPKSLDTVEKKRDKKVDYCTQSCFMLLIGLDSYIISTWVSIFFAEKEV